MDLKKKLLDGKVSIGIVGGGFIGFSTAAFFSREGIYSIIYDTDEEKVETINKRQFPDAIASLKKWLSFNPNFDLIKATGDLDDLKDCNPIFIAVPTEQRGEPWFKPLQSVISGLQKIKDKKLVIIESTLSPGTTDEIIPVGFKHDLAICPRRDWFDLDTSNNLVNLPRAVGGTTKGNTDEAMEVLSIVCKHLIPCNYQEAEFIKAVENSVRHLEITLANQLVLANPRINIRKVLEIVGTKWNIPHIYPSLKIAGRCIGPSSKYVLEGSENPEELSVLSAAVESDITHTSKLMEKFLAKFKPKKVGLLGLSYKGNLKDEAITPAKDIARLLYNRRIDFALNDPLYSNEEIESFGFQTFDYSKLSEFDILILIADHDLYRSIKPDYVGVVIDNTSSAMWEKWQSSFGDYILIGEPF